MKKGILSLLVVFIICISTSCSGKDNVDDESDGGPRFTGEILEIDSLKNKILIKGKENYLDFWLTVTNETKITLTSEEKITFDDLKAGDNVDTWFTGNFVKNSQDKFTQQGELKLAFLKVKN